MTPTWDLFILTTFILITAYSYIVGISGAAKVILSSYVGILVADGLGNLLNDYVFVPGSPIALPEGFAVPTAVAIAKIALFLALIVIFTVRSDFSVRRSADGWATNIFWIFLFGFFAAGLVISAVLVYSSGGSFLFAELAVNQGILGSMYAQSVLVRTIIDYASLWFTAPAMVFTLWGLVGQREMME